MTTYYTPEQLSTALFETDPMGTCCKENDCFDEYDLIAADVARRLESGLDLETALRRELADWFADDLAEAAPLQATLDWLKRER